MTRRVRSFGWPGMLLLVALGSTTATAQEPLERTAYARLLDAHVRPVTIAGIQLNAVDYAALPVDPSCSGHLGPRQRALERAPERRCADRLLGERLQPAGHQGSGGPLPGAQHQGRRQPPPAHLEAEGREGGWP